MLFAILTSLLATTALAAPAFNPEILRREVPITRPDSNVTGASDLQIIQLALYYENLEVAFFEYGSKTFKQADYTAAGFPDFTYGRLEQILENDQEHVSFLQSVVGNGTNNIVPCEYDFSMLSDAKIFLTAANALKQIVASGYTGSLENVDVEFARTTGSIAVVEAKHQTFIYASLFHGAGWSGPFDPYISLDGSYSLPAIYTKSCPSSVTTALAPFKLFPVLSVNGNPGGTAVTDGAKVQLAFNGSATQTGDVFVNIANGFGFVNVPWNNGSITLPKGLQGWSFLTVTSASSARNTTDLNTLAGPAWIHEDFSSSASNPGFMNLNSSAF